MPRKIVGWRVKSTPHAGFVPDALEQVVHERRPVKGMGPVRQSDRGSQSLPATCTERLADAAIEPSVGKRLGFCAGKDDRSPKAMARLIFDLQSSGQIRRMPLRLDLAPAE